MIAPRPLPNAWIMGAHENGTEDTWSGDLERLPYAVGERFVTNCDHTPTKPGLPDLNNTPPATNTRYERGGRKLARVAL